MYRQEETEMNKTMIVLLVLTLATGLIHAEKKQSNPFGKQPGDLSQLKVASIKVQTPNGGETWVKGGIGIVTWTTNVSQNVHIVLKATTVASGGEFVIATNIAPNAGKVVYGVPAHIGYDGKIFKVIISTMDGKVRDESDDTFTVRPMTMSASLSANPASFAGPCPATILFSGSITAEYPCEVTYYFGRNDGSKSPDYKISVAAGKPAAVSYSWQLNGDYSGHVTIYIFNPVLKNSNTAYFTVKCAQQTK